MKTPLESPLLRIQISHDCPRSCSNCSDLAPYFHGDPPMRPDFFATAVESAKGWLGPGRVLGVAGGEPTRHPDFEQISLSLLEILNLPPRVNGRAAIAEVQDMALSRLMERDGVCGLWTSLGDGFYRHFETIFEVYGHINVESHGSGKRHQAVMIDRGDYAEITGQSDERWQENRDLCPYQRHHGPAINDKGAYFCTMAATLDRLLFDGRNAWPLEKDWWKRKRKDFASQISLCDFCALAQPAPSQIDAVGRDILGRRAMNRLKGRSAQPFELFSRLHLNASRVCTDNPLTAGDTPRVEAGHASIKPRKLSCVLVSVGYGQALAESLPQNMPQFDQVVVVTTPEDETSRRVAEECGATVVLSRRCYDENHAFNKGRMMNDGVAALSDPDWVLFTDADIVMNNSLRAFVLGHALNPGCLYFTSRSDLTQVTHQSEDSNNQPNGYFQLFHPSAKVIRHRWPKPMSENFCSAGSVDSWFYQQWPDNKLILAPELGVSHIASRWLAENWNGLGEKKGRWCQLGLMTAQGMVAFNAIKTLPKQLRLTDTLFGEVTMVESDKFFLHVQLTDDGLVYNGKLLGTKHIHVAYFDDGTDLETEKL